MMINKVSTLGLGAQFIEIFKNATKEIAQAKNSQIAIANKEKQKQVKMNLAYSWLIYLNKQMRFQLYQGERPVFREIDGKLTFPLNTELQGNFQAEYDHYCKACIGGYISCLNSEINDIQRKIQKIEFKAQEKNNKLPNCYAQIENLINAICIEPDYLRRAKLEREKRAYENEIENIGYELQDLYEKYMEFKNTQSQIISVRNLVLSGAYSLKGYYNNQANQKVFILDIF